MEIFLNGTWLANTNYKSQLEGVDLIVATKKVSSMNSIAALAQHVQYYVQGVKSVFEGGDLEIRVKYSFDFPPIKSQQSWSKFLNKF